ncbi:Membrane protein,Tapt1/CMV receptor [Kalmanozyma brasiliensis GHG001]|uniref:Membrane protein,Tapt1/CMV receptor n=1 Tax=Kalmanozyma brasiliensis (strain GHG001) TaxID=1365824 RepID=UPI002867B65E|nr:Membrane protein,Tapt1/CMV receptor [Kalmanozyma brasiliensis GHG001]EST05368.2 Membrane protein,Tapt1/CMV receptor [Kalmanozyma brasiliensis GHG001]
MDAPSPSYSRESTVEPGDFIRPKARKATPAEEDEDVWEDEEDSILMDEHGNIIYEGPAYEDSASEFSDGADAQDLEQHRRSYREATQQYRKSRRALLLSGLSSYASSPSSEELGSISPTEFGNASASPSASVYESQRQTPEHESYYQPHLAESVDNADTGGRTNDLRYDYDSGPETKKPVGAAQDAAREAYAVKQEPTTPTLNDESSRAQRHVGSAVNPTNGRTSASADNGTTSERRARPSSAPRTLSSPLSPTKFLTPEQDGIRQRRSLRDLKPSTSAADEETYEYADAYMTPRLSLTTLHEEAKPNGSSIPQTPLPASEKLANRDYSPISPGATIAPTRQENHPFSLWDYLKEEVLATDFDATQEMKWERVTNFISIPFWMEKIILFGFVVCLDSFLYTFTILPLRFCVAMWTWLGNSARWILGSEKRYLHSSHKCDILKMLLIVLSCVILSRITDASKMYHSVRGQDVVKLSVIFNVLEIADRLCCSFGQDLLDSLFSRSTLARRKNGKQPYLRPIGFFCLSLCYVLAHTLVLFYQLVTLNVAINSYDNALLTLLLSNQFVEIKSSVFKKFEKENVFQMTCADIVERFQLTLMLSAIGLRNLIELSGGSLEPTSSPLPASFTVFPSLSLLETVLTPVCIVLASECIVDWLKHAFITKFNHIRPAVYGRFMDVLCRDLVVGGPSTKENSRKHTFVDQSPIISRRLGFAALPLACLLVRLILQIIGMIGDTSHIDECIAPISPRETGWIGVVARKLGANDIDNDLVRAMDLFVRGSAWALTLVIAWAFLVAVKLLLGTNLVSFASHRYATMHERENEESLNARDRAPIGTNKDERSYDKSLGRFIDRADDDAIQIKLDGTHVLPTPKERDKGKDAGHPKVKKENSLMEVSRYNMVRSRIW